MGPDVRNFRSEAHEIVDHMASYLEDLPERPVLRHPAVPGQLRASLRSQPPETPDTLAALLEEVEGAIVPGLTHWGHPGFLAYFGCTTTNAGIYGEMLAAAYNVSAMLWKTSPAATELEMLVLDWLRQWVGLPDSFQGVVYDTASVSSLHALAVARERLGLNIRELGLAGRPEVPRLRLYASSEAHSSIEKAAIALGLGLNSVCKIAVDDQFRMVPEALIAAIDADRSAGFLPFCVVGTAGTTSTTSVDPLKEIASICESRGLWFHVDAAYGGAIGLLAEGREMIAGWERADSIVINGHKWLSVPLDFSVLYTRHLDLLRQAFLLTPDYLETDFGDSVRNYMDYGVQLGRRFRALKAWFVFRSFGRMGLESNIREQMRLAHLFATWVDADADFVRLAPTPMAVVCFRAQPGGSNHNEPWLNALNERLMQAVNATGQVYLAQTRLNGRYAIRLAVGNIRTSERELQIAWELLKAHLGVLKSAGVPLTTGVSS